jgi:hypothetical protein
MASAAPPKQASPRHTVQEPADHDQKNAPAAMIAPTPIKAQGLAS